MAQADAILLVDADLIAFAAASIGQELIKDDDGVLIETKILGFQNVSSYIDNRVEEVMEACDTNGEPFMFLTGKTNFRNDIAKRKEYKAGRPPKPFHFTNAQMYIRSRYNTYVSVGCEADDLLAIAMTDYRAKDVPCILCSIDKDLRQVEGWHYGWETWNAPEMPLHFVDKFGHLEGHWKEGVSAKTGNPTKSFKKVTGDGYIWFMAQILMGDSTDNIPGIKGYGAKGAFLALSEATSCGEALSIVEEVYKDLYGETYEQELTEQAQLVYMIRERDKDSPDGLKHWSLKDAKEESTKD